MDTLFAVTAPGLEPFARRELRRLGLLPETAPSSSPTAAAVDPSGVTFQGDTEALYRANLELRTASRVLVRLGEFRAAALPELRKKGARLDWGKYLHAGQRVAIRATCHKSKLYHSGAVTERIAGAIADRLGAPVNVEKAAEEDTAHPPQLVVVRLVRDLCTISMDSSGALLHRRGYRQAVGKAPLRETLAAAMLMAADWDGSVPLLDPFCGSGVIPIEAALMALGIAPGHQRRFAFMDWPGFEAGHWEAVLAAATSRPHGALPPILASDRDAGAIRMAEENAARAGVADHIALRCQAVSAIRPPPDRGCLVTNPPYGIRISANKDLRNLYAQLGNVLRAKCPGWHVAILCNDPLLLGQTRLTLDKSLSLINGGVKVRLARGVVPLRGAQ